MPTIKQYRGLYDTRYYKKEEVDTILNAHTSNTSNPHNVTVAQVIPSYDTGWILRSVWGNVHLGSNPALNVDSNVTHNLNAPLSDILVKILISTDGTDDNSFEIIEAATGKTVGLTTYQIDSNNVLVQTGSLGIAYISGAGLTLSILAQSWHYKIKVYKLT